MSQTANTTEDTKAPRMSRGEKIFDWLVYGGIGGAGSFVATLLTTYWAKYGKGAEYFKTSTDWLQKKNWSAANAEKFMMTNATMQGGNLMVLPVKWAEDNKIALVTKINDMIGEKTDVAALENEDKQTWSSILKARVAAWITVFTSFHAAAHVIGDKKFGEFENKFAEHMICKPMGKPTHVGGVETTHFKYGKIAAIDVFATVAASTLLYVGSRVFAHWDREKADAQHTPASHTAPQQKVKEEVPAAPSNKAASKVFAAKAPAKDFASAALASRTGEQLQLGA